MAVLYFPGDWSSASTSSSNSADGTFQTDVTLTAKNLPPLRVQADSSDLDRIVANGTAYKLSQGAVFYVSPTGAIEQLPFKPLQPTPAYTKDLGKYFDAHPPEGVEQR